MDTLYRLRAVQKLVWCLVPLCNIEYMLLILLVTKSKINAQKISIYFALFSVSAMVF